jgi:hypothetical protein
MASSIPTKAPNPTGYAYSKLPNTNFIRLISFNDAGSGISISLTTHLLELAPEFDCLSYTWGDPTSPYSETAAMSSLVYASTGEISLDGHDFSVQYNLHDALEMLRDLPSSERSGYVWIDAISINQKDLAERAAQVSIMDSIYRNAKRVIVWLGPENEFTEDALSLLRTIGPIPEERYSHVQVSHWQSQELVFYQMGLTSPPSYEHWLGFLALVNSPYMKRVWIIQEVLVARDVVVLWGDEKVPWKLMAGVMTFLIVTGWHHYITTTHFKSLPTVIQGARSYKRMLEAKDLAVNFTLEQVRRDMVLAGPSTTLPNMLSSFRGSKASDPRDKIYALLNLVNKNSPAIQKYADALVIDYTISTRDLYIKITRVLLQGYSDLLWLCLLEDRGLRQMQSLPSWVPDYSAVLRPLPLMYRGYTGFNASKGVKQLEEKGGLTDDTFAVAGFRLSKLETIVDNFRDDVWMEEPGEFDAHWVKIFQLAANISEVQLKNSDPYGLHPFLAQW